LEKFLVDHNGKKGIVILDELEKVPRKEVLNSLLSVWESGRSSFFIRVVSECTTLIPGCYRSSLLPGYYLSRRTEVQIDWSK